MPSRPGDRFSADALLPIQVIRDKSAQLQIGCMFGKACAIVNKIMRKGSKGPGIAAGDYGVESSFC